MSAEGTEAGVSDRWLTSWLRQHRPNLDAFSEPRCRRRCDWLSFPGVTRRLSIVLAFAAGMFASQDGLAGPTHGQHFDLGSRNTTIEQFQQDRDDCVAKVVGGSERHSSRAERRHTCQNSPNPLSPIPGVGSGPSWYQGNMSPSASQDSCGYRDVGSPDKYYYADRAFLARIRAKWYVIVPESWGFRCRPLWK